jgi:hypothetical protein
VNAYEFLKTVRFDINARPAHKLFKKLSADEFDELSRLSALSEENFNKEIDVSTLLNPFLSKIADQLLYTKKAWFVKTGDFLVKMVFKAGEYFVNGLRYVAKSLKLIDKEPRERTSAERAKDEIDKAKKMQKLDLERREVLKEAVALIRADTICLQLKVGEFI